MRVEVLEIVNSLEYWEMHEVITELNNRMADKINCMEAFHKGIDNQVFGILCNKEQNGLNELGMKQVNYLKKLVEKFR